MTKTIESSLPRPSLGQPQFAPLFLKVALAMFLGTLDQSIVATALPAIASNLGGFSQVSWVVTAYLLSATVSAPIYGREGDAHGRKKILIVSLFIFLAGSIACGIAPNLYWLIGARALQGLGGGGLMTLSQALLGESVSPKDRGRFQGWFGATFALASTIGPVAGGVLTEHWGWRSIFWINIPVGLAALYLASRLDSTSGEGQCRLDYAGTGLFVFCTLLLLLILSMGGSSFPWLSPLTSVLCALVIIGYIVFILIERRVAAPLISPHLIGNPVVWRASLTVMLFASVLFGLIVELPILFQGVLGTSLSMSGMLLIPLTLAQVAVSTITGVMISRSGRPRNAMATSLSIVTVGFVLLYYSIGHGTILVGLVTLLIGAGLGSTMPAAQTMVQWAGGKSGLGEATGEVTLSRSIGAVFGAAIAPTVVLAAIRSSAPEAATALMSWQSVAGHHASLAGLGAYLAVGFRWLCVAMGLISAVAASIAWSIPNIDLSQSPDQLTRPELSMNEAT